MFELADKHDTPLFSSSALRFAKELSDYPNNEVSHEALEYVSTTGPGTYENYSVHQYELITSQMGIGAKRMKSLSANHSRLLMIEYEDGRQASFSQMQHMPFQMNLQLNNGEGIWIPACSDMFPRLIDVILHFFETGESPVPKDETLEIMALIEAGKKALKKRDVWITIDSVMK
ncbi:hypothetical protein [Bacillus sp. FSL K6-3431]|uniref:hypothetical protein n=1 Tax=Bacillus sp. FSL K6-3431 TaxID=2921500 RepID=UPI0030FA2C97